MNIKEFFDMIDLFFDKLYPNISEDYDIIYQNNEQNDDTEEDENSFFKICEDFFNQINPPFTD
jgi:hypothetical protein